MLCKKTKKYGKEEILNQMEVLLFYYKLFKFAKNNLY